MQCQQLMEIRKDNVNDPQGIVGYGSYQYHNEPSKSKDYHLAFIHQEIVNMPVLEFFTSTV